MPDFTTINFPSWATTDEAKAFFVFFVAACSIQLFRSGLRWFRAVSGPDKDA
jgi:hypothetical protein